jgi:hypothetical protein
MEEGDCGMSAGWMVFDKYENAIYQGSLHECELFRYEQSRAGSDKGLYVGPYKIANHHTTPSVSVKMDASAILSEVAATIKGRAAERDVEQERSMATAVKLFNEITHYDLTEYEGWMFMVCLKLARNRKGTMTFNRDHLLDGMAYMALALESRDAQ